VTGVTNLKPERVAVPPVVVTETGTVPAAWVLVVALISVELTIVTLAAVVVPNFTALTVMPVPLKPEPVIVIVVPPVVAAAVGANDVMVGAGTTYVKRLVGLAVPPSVPTPPAVVTEIGTAPATCASVTAVIVVGLVTV